MKLKQLSFYIVTFLAITVIGTSCSNKNGITITVKVNSTEKSVLYISKVNFSQTAIIDSVDISSGESTKKFRIKQDAEPTFYTLNLKNGGAITLLAKQGEKINVSFDSKNTLDYKVTGSQGSIKTQKLAVSFAKSKQKIDELSKEYINSTNDVERKKLEMEFQTVIDSQKAFNTKLIWEDPMSKVSIMALYLKYNDNLYLFDSSNDLLLFKTVASAWRALYPESDYTKGMLADINHMEQIITNTKLKQLIAQSEMSIPDLEIANKDGVKIKLSSLKGKVVLLDFWISSNTSSLLDNRELMDIYKQYKPKGFEVYQVSLDANREDWVNAIETSKIPWISVFEDDKTDVSNAAMTYNVTQIPANYLIGKDQSIIAKNIYGDDLRKKLNETLR